MFSKIVRLVVVIVAAYSCVLLSIYLPRLAAFLTDLVFSNPPHLIPAWISSLLFILYLFFISTVCFPFFLTIGWMMFADTKKRSVETLPFVSIIIPAYNEEQSILRSLEALNRIEYPSFEVIVVNDGSTDFTFSVIERKNVRCIHLRENQGKAAALNAGIADAKGSIIVFSDSDSWLHPMSVRYLVEGFTSSEIGAVSGSVEIEKYDNWIRRWQVIEYTFGQYFIKIAQLGSSRCVAICPGPVCAFRRNLLRENHVFSNRTITEDFDATLKIIGLGYRINYAPKAIAYTEAPASWKQLKGQRLRWFRGHIQTFRYHKDLFFAKDIGALGLYWLPVYYLFLGYVCGILELILIPLVLFLIVVSGDALAMFKVTSFYLLFAMIFVSSGYGIVLLHTRRFKKSLFLAACTIYPYLIYLNVLRVKAVFNDLRGKKPTWSG
jgi:cellulose synthase/poly-beta-1,6-N-acetylglucosamine synthase-like glycosyltransferase